MTTILANFAYVRQQRRKLQITSRITRSNTYSLGKIGPRKPSSLPFFTCSSNLNKLNSKESPESFGNFGFCALERGQQGVSRRNIINRAGPVSELPLSCE
jgi:hypothetical protein